MLMSSPFQRIHPYIIRHLLLLICIFALSTALPGQTTYESLRAGDHAYDRSNYSKAEPHYRRATEKDPSNWNAAYNLGNTLYEQGKYADASKVFEKAVANAPNTEAKADVLHNAGNALLKQNKFKEAIKAYESSLRLRPGDPDTKMNLQIAKKKNKEEEQQQQQKKQQQQDQQENKDQNQEQQQNQQPQDQQQQNQQQNKDQKQQEQQQKQQQGQEQQQKPTDAQRVKQEEAKRLLETTIGPEDRKNAQKYRAAQQKKAPPAGKKDW